MSSQFRIGVSRGLQRAARRLGKPGRYIHAIEAGTMPSLAPTERERERQGERQRDRETERQRKREIERDFYFFESASGRFEPTTPV